jgi:hypothetical protein
MESCNSVSSNFVPKAWLNAAAGLGGSDSQEALALFIDIGV